MVGSNKMFLNTENCDTRQHGIQMVKKKSNTHAHMETDSTIYHEIPFFLFDNQDKRKTTTYLFEFYTTEYIPMKGAMEDQTINHISYQL